MTSTSVGGVRRGVTIRIKTVHLGTVISSGRKVKHTKLINDPVYKDPDDPNSAIITSATLSKNATGIIFETLITALGSYDGTSLAFNANKTKLSNLIKYGASSPADTNKLASLDLNHGAATAAVSADTAAATAAGTAAADAASTAAAVSADAAAAAAD